jgi:hypothetical protein
MIRRGCRRGTMEAFYTPVVETKTFYRKFVQKIKCPF